MYTYLERIDDGLPMRSAGKWAEEKLDYLRRYIDVFETSMRSKWRFRNYIDLQAGPGKNYIKETGEVLLGSPLVALTTKYPFTGYHFIEFDADLAEALETRCSASTVFKQVHIKTGDCNHVVDTIVNELKTKEHLSLNLAFLDPEGLELHWSTVARLASIKRMDLIVNYPQGGLNRYMALAIEDDDETAVDLFFGSRDWRHIYSGWQVSRGSGLHRQLIDLYLSKLKALGYTDLRRDDEVEDEPLIRNSKRRAPLYRLLFASKHPLADNFWHDVTRRDVYGQRRLFDK
jgi:three-Cys-motif partner protein